MSDTSFMEIDEEEINANVATEVGKMMRILHAKEKEIESKEAELKLLNADQDKLLKETIPQIFKKNGITGILLSDGTTVSATEELTCTLIKDKERRATALAWLIDNGGEELIKDYITIESPSVALLEQLNSKGVMYEPTKDINTNSLKAWFREKIGFKQGIVATLEAKAVPKEFSLFVYDIAKIKTPKK